jgi:lysylphosphatidylglycerol synthetase-like protein (DUF2156 family)
VDEDPGTGADADRTVLVRRMGAAVILVAALTDLASALTPPLRHRLLLLADVVPLAAHRAATAVAACTGIVLLQVARGVRRGQRLAWATALLLLAVSAWAHVFKGLDVEEALVATAALVFLIVSHRYFHAPTDRDSVRRGLATMAFGAVTAIAVATVTVQLSSRRMSWPTAVAAVTERLVGSTTLPLGGRLGATLTLALTAVGLGLVLSAGWLLVRPVLRLPAGGHDLDGDEARGLVARYGHDTLAYFALRDDKHHVRVGHTLVAYAVHNGVCLVSPDPIGPADERSEAWAGFRRHATRHGWSVAVLGASEAWLPVYRAGGMAEHYIGDEAVVDCTTFSLAGGAMKGVRQAVHRVDRYGYTVSFHDPATIDAPLAASLQALMAQSRQGAVERGFSMTLSRLFDPCDHGLLLAVCTGPDGRPVAFCQFVPAPEIAGYSLDLTRRANEGDHPNGLTDSIVVRTIEYVRARGGRGLSLNFAAMRAVLAGETGGRWSQRVERRVVSHLSESMQIESLWRYNAKFAPVWRRRYLVYDSPEHLLAVGLAVATAEQFWELPVVGRLLPA